MSDRKAELERKKAKLEQMRHQKLQREKEKQARFQEEKETSSSSRNSTPNDPKWKEAEKILEGLDIPLAPSPIPFNSGGSFRSESPKVSGGGDVISMPPLAADSPGGGGSSSDSPATRRRLRLAPSKVATLNIAPKEMVSYDKDTQTPCAADLEKDARPVDYYNLVFDLDSASMHSDEADDHQGQDGDRKSSKGRSRQTSAGGGGGGDKKDATATTDKQQQQQLPSPPKPVELTEDEKRNIESSEDYLQFIGRSVRVIERALAEDVDIFTDYVGEKDEEALDASEKLKMRRCFFDERWSKHRVNLSLDWSPQFPELLLASYGSNDEAPLEPDGVVLVWNSKFKTETPEFVFHCQSAVTSACFAKFNPHLVVGGTYSGQIVLWDNRSSKRTPVQRTSLSAVAHTHPVYCVNVVGTQNAHNLISLSNDGKMCSWSLDMLSQPQDTLDVSQSTSGSKPVAVTSMDFPTGDVNNFIIGSEQGSVYTASRHGSKAGINGVFDGHQGPVTGIDCHHVQGPIDFSHLFLTSSCDWTIKLWSSKSDQLGSVGANSRSFLHSFEDFADYVLDVAWSPIHPALFACVDITGRLDLWNLNGDTEVPTASIRPAHNVALNKLRWAPSGHHLAVGDDVGYVRLFDVGEAIATPRPDEFSRFAHTLQDIRNEAAAGDEDTRLSMGGGGISGVGVQPVATLVS